MSTIYWLDDCDDPSAVGVGGKGASLIRLRKGGFPVPSGFVVGAAGYREWIEYNGLQAGIDALLGVADLHLPKVAREMTAQLLPTVAAAGLPSRLQDEVIGAHRELQQRRGSPVVAVRSSALSEDGAASSSAGLYETFLNVCDEAALLDSLLQCYRSLWAHRAVQYRAYAKLDGRREAMGVVIMEMVAAEVSGVVFTVNPVTCSADEIVINASWGLGEAIVSGRVTPDSFIVRKRGMAVVSREVYDKELMITPQPSGRSGTMDIDVPPDMVRLPALADAAVIELAGLCLRIEQFYGGPQDIEWALHNGKFYALQSRPVTGLR